MGKVKKIMVFVFILLIVLLGEDKESNAEDRTVVENSKRIIVKTVTGNAIEVTEIPNIVTGTSINESNQEVIQSIATVQEIISQEMQADIPATQQEIHAVLPEIQQEMKEETKIESISFLNISSNYIRLAKKQSRELSLLMKPKNVSVDNWIWTSSDESVVTVNSKGKITGKGVGKAKITVFTQENGGISKEITVSVVKRQKGTYYSEKGMEIVNVKHQKYTYNEMVKDIKKLAGKYSDCFSYQVLGQSHDKRNIYQVVLGNPDAKKKILLDASIHAREYMTTQLVMKQIEFYCSNYYTGTYEGIYFNELFEDVCFVIVPMVNPDGVTISQFGAAGIRNIGLRNQIKKICKKYGGGRSGYYTTWKANARGVDINRNFNQYWYIFRTSIKSPQASYYKGKAPVSENESKILRNVFLKEKPTAVINYHAMGQVLYWEYGQKGEARIKEYKLLYSILKITKYHPIYEKYSKKSGTGFGDWVAISGKTPVVTIEIGRSACPLPSYQFSSIWNQNKCVFLSVAGLYYKQ